MKPIRIYKYASIIKDDNIFEECRRLLVKFNYQWLNPFDIIRIINIFDLIDIHKNYKYNIPLMYSSEKQIKQMMKVIRVVWKYNLEVRQELEEKRISKIKRLTKCICGRFYIKKRNKKTCKNSDCIKLYKKNYDKNYYLKNRINKIEYQKKYNKEHSEKYLKIMKEYRLKK